MKPIQTYISEALLSKKTGMYSKSSPFPEDMPYDTKHTDDPENIWELLVYLDDHGHKFTVEHGRFKNSTDVAIETKYNGVTVVLSFIRQSEYFISMDKNGKEIYSLNIRLGWGNHFDLDLLDPLKYLKLCLSNMEKRLASAKKGKRNRRTGEIEKNLSDISYYEGKVEMYKKCIEQVK